MGGVVSFLVSGQRLPPAGQRAVAIASWACALGAAWSARGGESFDLALYIVGYTVVYFSACFAYQKWYSDGYVAGYPLWSFFGSILHGLVVLPIILTFAWRAHMLAGGHAMSNSLAASTFLRAPWAKGSFTTMLEHSHCAVIGFLLKDYSSLYPIGLESGYVVHHLASVLGCSMCLMMPMGAGLTALNAIQAEVASAIYSASLLWPNALTVLAYRLLMTASNLFVCYLSYEVWLYPIALGWRLPYAIMAVLLVALRQVALVLTLFAEPEKPKKKGKKGKAA